MNLKFKAVKQKKKTLGISIDTTLSFEYHITFLYKKVSQKLHTLARIAHHMEFEKRRSLMKAFVISQFKVGLSPSKKLRYLLH